MKKSLFILLSLVATSAFADLRSELRAHQKSLANTSSSSAGGAATGSVGVVATGPQLSSATKTSCQETKMTSLPLSNLLDLVQDAAPAMDVDHDPRRGVLTISTPNMIGNCNEMLDLPVLTPKKINDQSLFTVEVKFKPGRECTYVKDKDGKDTKEIIGCTYDVMKKSGDDLKKEAQIFEPTLSGFKKCLADSGVVKDGKINSDGIFPQSFKHSFENVKESGSLVFQSHGPAETQGAAFGKFLTNQGCDYYENIQAQPKYLTTAAEEDAAEKNRKAESLKSCSISQIEDLSRFINENPTFAFLKAHQETLLTDAVKDVANQIATGKEFTADHLQVLDYFKQHVLVPRMNELRQLMAEIQAMPAGAERTAKLAQLNTLKQKLASYNEKPFLTQGHVEKLLNDGYFEGGEKVFGIRAAVVVYSKLGQKIGSTEVTNASAEEVIKQSLVQFGHDLVTVKDRYEVRTGQSKGQAETYTQNIADLQRLAQERQAEYQELIKQEMLGAQQCQTQFWRTKQCQADAAEAVKSLQASAVADAKEYSEEITKLENKAVEYLELERQGRIFQAEQNGEKVSAADSKPITRPKTTRQPTSTPADQSNQTQQQAILAYQQQMAQQQAAMWQQQQQQQQMGANYPSTGGGLNFGFNLGAGLGMNQQQQLPYGQMPMFGQQQQTGFSPYAQQGYNPYMQQQQGFNPFMQQQQAYNPMMGMGQASPYSSFMGGGMNQGAYNPMQYQQPGFSLFGGSMYR